jgi:hypothetical protein
MKSKKQILNTTEKWLNASEARIVLGVSGKNLAATAKRHGVKMKENDGRSFVYSTASIRKLVTA